MGLSNTSLLVLSFNTEYGVMLLFCKAHLLIISVLIFNNRFVPSKLEDIFRKHARSNQNALTSQELMDMLKANREPKDYKGWWVGLPF